jgi:AmpD protein
VVAISIAADGWADGVRRVESGFCDERPPATTVDLLLLHNVSLPPGQFGTGCVEALFTGRLDGSRHPFLELVAGLRVSAHFLIDRRGGITQFVSCRRRAWHAGASRFEGRADCNDFSVGIELEGTDFTAFEPAQYEALAALTAGLRAALPLRAVRGHCHVAPGRKTDPGPLFDWPRYAARARLPSSWLP